MQYTYQSPLPHLQNPMNTAVFSRIALAQLISENTNGIIVIKFGAEWCAPCKRIQEQVEANMAVLPANVQTFVVDIDESIDVYSFLKSKKVVSGIPALLSYYPSSVVIAPENSLSGSDPTAIDHFFKQVHSDALDMLIN